MNIKTRLGSTAVFKPGNKNRFNPYREHFTDKYIEEPSVIFNENSVILNIITNEINSGTNILYICPRSCNKQTIAGLFKNYVRRNINVNFPHTTGEYKDECVNFIPDISKEELVNIMQESLFGLTSFVAGVHLDSYENIIDKLKMIIALNTRLEEKYLNILLGAFSPLLVNITIENGIYTVKNADRLISVNNEPELKSLYSYFGHTQVSPNDLKRVVINVQPNNSEVSKNDSSSENVNISAANEVADVSFDNIQVQDVSFDTVSNDEPAEELQTELNENVANEPVNKYKKLKEKIKSKREKAETTEGTEQTPVQD